MTSAEAVEWWGNGEAPTARWPGVTIPVDECSGRYRFDASLADRVCDWFPRYCSHSKGEFAGKPFDLLGYQVALILRPIFGWLEVDSGFRRFRKAYIQIPKKQGKTTLIAGLSLYMLLADREPGAEVYVAAADREQARILFDAAKAMVEKNKYLAKRVVVFRNEIRRVDDPTAFFRVLSSEAASKHGPNIHCLIIDELHAQPNRELYETLTRGVIARRQPLTLLITTAGDDDESICAEQRDYAMRVLSGTIQDETFLPVVFEASPDDDPFSPETWRKVNPALGVTISEAAMAAMSREAQNEPKKRNGFLRYHLNRWVNQATAWIPVEWWDACDAPMPSDEELRGLVCAGGLDLAQKIDLACLSVTFLQPVSGSVKVDVVSGDSGATAVKQAMDLNFRIVVVPFFWIPEETMRQREKEDGLPYSQWVESGLVTATEGAIIDYSRIYQDITTKIVGRFPQLKQAGIGYDPAFATDIASRLRDLGGFKVEEILQGYKYLSEPSYVLEALVKAGRVVHGGHRTLRNHIETVAIKTDDSGRIRPVKPKKAHKRIDGVVATLMGLRSVMKLEPAEPAYQMLVVG